VDLPLLDTYEPAILSKGAPHHRVCDIAIILHCRTRISDFLRHIRNLFPNSDRPETTTPDACQHVLLCATYHSNCSQYLRRYGHPQLAEGGGCHNRIFRRDNRFAKQATRFGKTKLACTIAILLFLQNSSYKYTKFYSIFVCSNRQQTI
jgi:hypothetical protein